MIDDASTLRNLPDGSIERRWKNRPEPSTWGEFGRDDTLGRLNLLTAEKVRAGLAEIVSHQTFALGLPLNLPGGTDLNPNRLPPIHRPNLRGELVNANCRYEQIQPGMTDVFNDDLIILHNQYSSQWDALVHVGALFDADGDGIAEPVYYNGFRAGIEVTAPTIPADCGVHPADGRELTTTANFGPLGIHSMAAKPIQGRAVMIDVAHHFGTHFQLIGWAELSAVLERDRIDIQPGDIILIHTGYAQYLIDMAGTPEPQVLHNYGAQLDGSDPQLLKWITTQQIAAIAADNPAVEQFPAPPQPGLTSVLPLHEHCLFKLGVPMGELWYLTELAQHLRTVNRTAFLLTAPPLNLPGAAGSPVNPIATV
ncbi:cyclase family protein [Enteractinococcus helveticum]|uniref:Cyclase n=1 Tax=Enteractinococcus helveticum TaxID=1837282 RepID=A0A1B7M2S6_9MICC|nr:cyclase family protein [Enteractinococcus helveticum]OAV62865.1 cyclase [Enteractinococcus helveticum]